MSEYNERSHKNETDIDQKRSREKKFRIKTIWVILVIIIGGLLMSDQKQPLQTEANKPEKLQQCILSKIF